jgi:ribosomal protein S18 acetylase RimI-like enzyme
VILHCLYIDRVNPDFTALPAPYQAGFLDAAALRPYVGRPEFDMPESFLRRALDAHDECFAIREGDRLAAYGWYAIGANHFADGLTLHFSPEWVYMYRGYTHPAYRGQRLHAIGMTLALEAYRARGFKGLVSCVEAGNTASLKSVDRMGYRRFGTIYGIRLGRLVGMRHATSGWRGRQVIYSTPGCKTFGFRLERRPGFDATSSAPEPLKV